MNNLRHTDISTQGGALLWRNRVIILHLETR